MAQRLPHRIERTKNKHSRAVYSGNTIVIRLARNLSHAEEQEHIQNLLRRMAKLVLLDKKKTPLEPFRPLLEGASSVQLHIGRRTVSFTLRPGTKTRATRVRGGWRVDVSRDIRWHSLHRFLWSLLSSDAEPYLLAMLHEINARTFRARIMKTSVRFASTQWGSCTRKGRIMLNTALVLLPKHLQKYVIVHELAHTRRADHSPAYWREVETMLPGYMGDYKELQQFRLASL